MESQKRSDTLCLLGCLSGKKQTKKKSKKNPTNKQKIFRGKHENFHPNNFVVPIFVTLTRNAVRSSHNVPVFSDLKARIFIMVMN